MTSKDTLSFPAIMLLSQPLSAPAVLPEGYIFVGYRPGLEEDWCKIQYGVNAFPDLKTARRAFDSEFSHFADLLPRRMVFVQDAQRRTVAAACLWPGDDLGKRMEQVRWVAVAANAQDQGIGKALVAKLMEIFQTDSRNKEGIYLITQTTCFKAIHIFRKHGFAPYLGPCPRRFQPFANHFEAETHLAWQFIDKKLAEYREASPTRSSDDTALLPTQTMLFEHETMFNKCRICKVFEITAPAQSGDTLHSHDYSQIWYVTRGSCEHYVEGHKHEMFVGDAFLLPPKVIHRTVLREGGSIICCEFNMDDLFSDQANPSILYHQVREITQNISFTMQFQQELNSTQPRFTFSRKGQRAVEKLMYSMLEEYTQGAAYFEHFLHLQIMELLLTFAREYTQSPMYEVSGKVYDKYRSMVENAIAYIDEHYDEALTLDEICKISMVSKTYFCYLFKLLTHKTFVQYLMDKRINKAMELLRQTDIPIIDIGQAVGFHDSTHFSRTFKRLKGISPREYRSTAQKR